MDYDLRAHADRNIDTNYRTAGRDESLELIIELSAYNEVNNTGISTCERVFRTK